MRILFLEDNRRLQAVTAQALRAAGFAVDAYTTVADAQSARLTTHYDCMVLDLGLPDGDGSEVLSAVRATGSTIPVLVLTARDDSSSVIGSLDSGADDYLRKPFNVDELVARLRAVLRRPGGAYRAILEEGNIALDPSGRRATINGAIVDFTRREVGALEMLMRLPGRVIEKSSLESALYGYDDEVSTNAIEVLIHRLRKKLAIARADREIITLRGLGYLLSENRR